MSRMAQWCAGAMSRSTLPTKRSRRGGRWKRGLAGRRADVASGSRLLAVANRFDVVAIGIKDKRPIVVFVIMRAQPRWPVILSSGCERHPVKLLHGFPVLGREGDVGAGLRSISQADPEECFPICSIAGEGWTFGIQAFDAERTQCLVIKRL